MMHLHSKIYSSKAEVIFMPEVTRSYAVRAGLILWWEKKLTTMVVQSLPPN